MSAIVDGESIDLSSLMARVFEITRDLFPGEVSTYILDNPEYPQSRYTVIEAQASGPAEDLLERQLEWHRRVCQLGESCSDLRLTFDYRE